MFPSWEWEDAWDMVIATDLTDLDLALDSTPGCVDLAQECTDLILGCTDLTAGCTDLIPGCTGLTPGCTDPLDSPTLAWEWSPPVVAAVVILSKTIY